MPPTQVAVYREDVRAPVVFERVGGPTGDTWIRDNVSEVERAIESAGAALLRGFSIDTPELLEALVHAFYGAPMSYRENTSPRTILRGEIRNSTNHPADQLIELHCEQSYSRMVPMRLLFACRRPADFGGETHIADIRHVLDAIPRDIAQRFASGGYVYRRNFQPGFGPDWQTTYQIHDRQSLERYLAWAGISWRWDSAGLLRTETRRASIIQHPRTAEAAWFNHILFWHHSSLEPEIAAELLHQFGEENLPHSVSHGDGSLITLDEIECIRAAHKAAMWSVQWQQGDLLILDNLLRAHGRAPYSGPRAIMFAMGLPFDTVNMTSR